MTNFFIIANVVNGKTLMGYRVFDELTGEFRDSTLESVRNNIQKIANAGLKEDGKTIVGINGSLERLTAIEYETGKPVSRQNSFPYIVLNKLGTDKYTVVDWCGNMSVVDENKLIEIEIYDAYGLGNCKIKGYSKSEEIEAIKKKFKGFKGFPNEVWVCEMLYFRMQLEGIADQVGLTLKDNRNYMLVLSDLISADELTNVKLLLIEEPHRNFTADSVSKAFYIGAYSYEESDDERSADVVFNIKDDILSMTFEKRNILSEIIKKMED